MFVMLGTCVFALFAINGFLVGEKNDEYCRQLEEEEQNFMLEVGVDPWFVGEEA
jgi:hypothetical protein